MAFPTDKIKVVTCENFPYTIICVYFWGIQLSMDKHILLLLQRRLISQLCFRVDAHRQLVSSTLPHSHLIFPAVNQLATGRHTAQRWVCIPLSIRQELLRYMGIRTFQQYQLIYQANVLPKMDSFILVEALVRRTPLKKDSPILQHRNSRPQAWPLLVHQRRLDIRTVRV